MGLLFVNYIFLPSPRREEERVEEEYHAFCLTRAVSDFRVHVSRLLVDFLLHRAVEYQKLYSAVAVKTVHLGL